MTHNKVSSSQIYTLQAVFILAYIAGIALTVGFIVGAFLLANWGLNFIIIDLFNALSITTDPNVVSNVFVLTLLAFSILKSLNKLKTQLGEYCLMIVNIKSINNH